NERDSSGIDCSTPDRDVSASLNIRRCAVGPGPRPTELYYWEGRSAMPKPGQPGQVWVDIADKALLRKWRRKLQLRDELVAGAFPCRAAFAAVGLGNSRIHISLAQPSPAQPSPAQPSPAQPSPAQPSPAQPSPAQPSLAQPTPAQPSLARPAQPSPAQPDLVPWGIGSKAKCLAVPW
ncbi:hypothetical protein QJQ45_016421, partial [Haematococcus lacustris]